MLNIPYEKRSGYYNALERSQIKKDEKYFWNGEKGFGFIMPHAGDKQGRPYAINATLASDILSTLLYPGAHIESRRISNISDTIKSIV
ncbi:MAG: hypothetical protein C5S41_00235 [Candidatus Methanomarinus sp.]|nr:MAG: hypothetical protein C5S41_00235 [ANME-2 cluster archaeon]